MSAAAPSLPPPPPGKKYCIACDELIPVEASVCSHCRSSQVPEKTSWDKTGLKWIAAITAVIGLITGLSNLVGPLKGWWSQGRQSKTMLAAAQRQAELGEYSTAFDTYSEILKTKPNNPPALHGRLDVTMQWIEAFPLGNVRSNNRETDEANQKRRAIIDRITPVLEAGLTSGKGYRDADVVAHTALKMDPGNVYANAMLGRWLLDTNSNMDEATPYFAVALKSGKEKPFVRECELRSMIYNDNPGVRAELIRVADDMRKNSEPIGDGDRERIYSYNLSVNVDNAELREALAAVPPEDVMATYDWLAQTASDLGGNKNIDREFIQANLSEVIGHKSEALRQFQQLQQDMKNAKMTGSLMDRVNADVKRVPH